MDYRGYNYLRGGLGPEQLVLRAVHDQGGAATDDYYLAVGKSYAGGYRVRIRAAAGAAKQDHQRAQDEHQAAGSGQGGEEPELGDMDDGS